jgi:hypothetical protein
MGNVFKARGKQRRRWRDNIKDTLQQYKLTIKDATTWINY